MTPTAPPAEPDDTRDEINEAEELRREDSIRRYDARMEEMDREDRAGKWR